MVLLERVLIARALSHKTNLLALCAQPTHTSIQHQRSVSTVLERSQLTEELVLHARKMFKFGTVPPKNVNAKVH